MYPSHAFRLFGSCLLAGAAVVGLFGSSGLAGSLEKTARERSVYHADPEHLWNRLHAALFVRVGPDGRAYGRDRLEPLLWPGSMHLLEERSNKRAVALLEEFVKDKGEKLIDDPLKRAVLQRDLWLVFNWLEDKHGYFAEPGLKPEEARGAGAIARSAGGCHRPVGPHPGSEAARQLRSCRGLGRVRQAIRPRAT